MMNSRERVQRAVRFESPDRVPRDLWALPGVTEGRKAEWEAHLRRFPTDFGWCRWKPGQTGREQGTPYRKGRIALWGELDRQHLQPFGRPAEIRAAVRRVGAAFDTGHGGLIAQTEWGKIAPYANIAAMYDEWELNT